MCVVSSAKLIIGRGRVLLWQLWAKDVLMMSFSSSHGLSVFTNACRSSPSCGRADKKRPKTAPLHKATPSPRVSLTTKSSVEISRRRRQAAAEKKTSFDPTTKQPEGASPAPLTDGSLAITSSVKPPSKYSTLFQTLIETNSLLQQEVQKLKREHRVAMSKLTHLESSRQLQDSRTDSESRLLSQSLPPSSFAHQNSDESVSDGGTVHEKPRTVGIYVPSVKLATDEIDDSEEQCGYQTPEEFESDNENDRVSESGSVRSIESYQITYISSSSSGDESTDDHHYASPGMIAVEKMWDNFTVDNTRIPSQTQQGSNRERGRGKKDWIPRRVTVPKPFNMTIRDANQLKKKSKSMIAAEKESAERLASEVAETRIKFRANPIPVHTYLPLYQLTNAKNEQRREMARKMNRTTSQKPFKFAKRDELKQQQKAEMQKEAEKMRRKQTEFKAKPIPAHMFSSQIEEDAMEKEAYRKIRMQMRAAKLLAEAKPPYSMRLASQSSLGTKSSTSSVSKGKGKSQASYTHDCSFHPKITRRLPDYNKVYSKFQEELAKKKQSKLTTVSEPFLLRTERRAKVKHTSSRPSGSSIAPQKLKKCYSTPPSPAPYPPHMTETARRRQVLTQVRLAEAGEKEAIAENEENARKMRSKAMQKLVAEKTSMMDMSGILEEKKKIKCQKLK